MKKRIVYQYENNNGEILSSYVRLDGVPYKKHYELTADAGKVLTMDNQHFYTNIVINPTNLGKWREIKDNGQI